MNSATSSAQREIRIHVHVGSEAKKEQGIFTTGGRGAHSQDSEGAEVCGLSAGRTAREAPGVFRECAPSAHARAHSGITALPPTKLHSLNLRRKASSAVS